MTIINTGQMQAIAHDGGQLVGLGDGRQVGFGRFEVKEFEIERYSD